MVSSPRKTGGEAERADQARAVATLGGDNPQPLERLRQDALLERSEGDLAVLGAGIENPSPQNEDFWIDEVKRRHEPAPESARTVIENFRREGMWPVPLPLC